MPAESCVEIASGEGKLVSNNYWLKESKLGEVFEVIYLIHQKYANEKLSIMKSLSVDGFIKHLLC